MKTQHWHFDKVETSNLQARSTRNVGINLVAQGIRFVLQVGSTIALARILSPTDFGLVAMVAVIVNFVALFKDAGLAQATVQREDITDAQISTLYWINVAIAGGLALAIVALAPVIVWIYDEPRLLYLAMLLALPVAISGWGLQHRALLQRHMRFVAIARVEILGAGFGIALGLTAALYGAGYWSLAFMTLGTALASNLGYWSSSGWVPQSPRRNTGVREMLRFGINLSGFNFVNYFARNADNFLIGKFIGATALGQYSQAYRLMLLPISQINAPITNALLPALSRVKDDQRAFEDLYLQWVQRIAWITVIPIASASLWGEEALVFILGQQWQLAGEIFEWLALACCLQPIGNFAGLLFVSKGETSQMLRWGVFASVFTVIAFAVGLQWGAKGVAIGYAAAMFPLFLALVFFSSKVSGMNPSKFLKKTLGPVAIAGIFATVRVFG